MALHLEIYKIEFVREYVFAVPRKWKFDFCIPTKMIAIEIEGGTRQIGRHNRHAGFTKDCEKYNTASLLGWRLFRFTSEMVHAGNAIDTIVKAISPS